MWFINEYFCFGLKNDHLMNKKLIILTAAITTVVLSCNNDRDEEARKKAIESVKASSQTLKINNPDNTVSVQSAVNSNDNTLNPQDPTGPVGEDPTIDPTKPDRPR